MEDEEKGRLVFARDLKELWKDKKGSFHRLHGPAITHPNGDMSWYIHGQRHRDDGPAIYWPERKIEVWYKDGKKYQPSAHELMVWKMKKKEG